MLKKLHVLLLVLLAAVCFTATAWADYDYIEQYGVMVTPNTEDGSLLITVKLEWTPLEELPYGQELKAYPTAPSGMWRRRRTTSSAWTSTTAICTST